MLFIDFPPVLQLQLKRFEYDFMRDTMVKVRQLLWYSSSLLMTPTDITTYRIQEEVVVVLHN